MMSVTRSNVFCVLNSRGNSFCGVASVVMDDNKPHQGSQGQAVIAGGSALALDRLTSFSSLPPARFSTSNAAANRTSEEVDGLIFDDPKDARTAYLAAKRIYHPSAPVGL